MDVTLTPKMERFLETMLDAVCGEQPSIIMIGPGARRQREMRALMREQLHRFAALSMRIGGARALADKGYPISGGARDMAKAWNEFDGHDSKTDKAMVETLRELKSH